MRMVSMVMGGRVGVAGVAGNAGGRAGRMGWPLTLIAIELRDGKADFRELREDCLEKLWMARQDQLST